MKGAEWPPTPGDYGGDSFAGALVIGALGLYFAFYGASQLYEVQQGRLSREHFFWPGVINISVGLLLGSCSLAT